jgi:hypothetical protein
MSEMVERVAKAIYEKRNGTGCVPWSRRPQAHRDPYLADASAAIEAMRMPAGSSSVEGGLAIEESMFASEDTVFHGAAKCWNAMISAALHQSPSKTADSEAAK